MFHNIYYANRVSVLPASLPRWGWMRIPFPQALNHPDNVYCDMAAMVIDHTEAAIRLVVSSRPNPVVGRG